MVGCRRGRECANRRTLEKVGGEKEGGYCMSDRALAVEARLPPGGAHKDRLRGSRTNNHNPGRVHCSVKLNDGQAEPGVSGDVDQGEECLKLRLVSGGGGPWTGSVCHSYFTSALSTGRCLFAYSDTASSPSTYSYPDTHALQTFFISLQQVKATLSPNFPRWRRSTSPPSPMKSCDPRVSS